MLAQMLGCLDAGRAGPASISASSYLIDALYHVPTVQYMPASSCCCNRREPRQAGTRREMESRSRRGVSDGRRVQ